VNFHCVITTRSTDLVLVPGLVCTEDLFAEQIASLQGEVAISVADHTRHDTMSAIARAVLALASSPASTRSKAALTRFLAHVARRELANDTHGTHGKKLGLAIRLKRRGAILIVPQMAALSVPRVDSVMRSVSRIPSKTGGKVRLDDGKHNIFRSPARRRPARPQGAVAIRAFQERQSGTISG
jgi:hypothetical protein